MKFRFYQLLLVASLVFTILAMLDPVVSFTESNGAASVMTNFKYTEFATGNVYESVAIIGKRSNQIAAEMKEELLKKLNEFSSSTDNLEEQFENHEQIEISRYYERLPKPTLIAAQEFLDDKIYFRDPSKEAASEEA